MHIRYIVLYMQIYANICKYKMYIWANTCLHEGITKYSCMNVDSMYTYMSIVTFFVYFT